MWQIEFLSISCEFVLRFMRQNLIDDIDGFVQGRRNSSG